MVCRNITLRGNNAALRRVATRDSQLPGSARLNGRPPCPPISVPLYSSLSSSKRTYGLSRVYFNTWTSLQHTWRSGKLLRVQRDSQRSDAHQLLPSGSAQDGAASSFVSL